MKHLAQLQTEFVKSALDWNDLSADIQRDYIRSHPKTKKRFTARPSRPTTFEAWIPGKTFMNLETKQRSSFEDLPAAQQEVLRKKFEHEKETFVPEPEPEKVEREKLKKFTIMGGVGEGDVIRAKDAQDAMAKFLVIHEQYPEEQAQKAVQSEQFTTDEDGTVHHGNYEIKELKSDKKKKKMTERKVKRLARKVKKDIKGSGKEMDGVELDVAKNILDMNPELQEYFKDKGVAEDKWAEAFADYIATEKPQDGDRVLKRKLKRAYKAGKKAWNHEDGPNLNNPYESGSQEYVEWNKGSREAEAVYNKKYPSKQEE